MAFRDIRYLVGYSVEVRNRVWSDAALLAKSRQACLLS